MSSAGVPLGRPHSPAGRGAPGASDPLWAGASVWQEHVAACAAFPAGLALLELCGGASTAQCVLDLLLGEGRAQCVGCYDSAAECGPVARRVHRGAAGAVRVGARGDILRIPPDRFPSANVVVSGPPCPPWSSMGSRRSLQDERASVFLAVVNVIVDLANREGQCRPLLCFVLENVEGFTHAIAGGHSAHKVVSDKLRGELPSHWTLRTLHMNSADYGLPQHRRRIYLIGRSGQWFSRGPLRQPPVFGPTPPLRPFLRQSVRGSGRVAFTRIQSQSLGDWKAFFAAQMADSANRGQCAVVDLSRTPSGRTEWGGFRPRADLCQCLTASGPMLHVFALGEGQCGRLSLDRLLLVSERAALQGFPSRVASADLTEVAGRRIFGNAMSVPVIGSVMAVLLRELLGQRSAERLREAFAEPAAGAASAGQQPATPTHRRARRPVPSASAGQERARSRSRSPARTPPLRPPTPPDSEGDVDAEER
ncbi:MAG: DNA cytosine methyltransferase, partial [bacterium]|nr:DNA cytosine methyltransferase [bacterium]